jgi:hypothetical protein
MGHLENKEGVALMMVLILSVITLAIVSALLYFVVRSTEISGMQKRYRTASEAAKGGIELMTKEIISDTVGGDPLSSLGSYGGLVKVNPAQDSCFSSKLTRPVEEWPASCDRSMDPKTVPDVIFTLQGISPQPNFTVYEKIVDTVPGNTDTSGLELDADISVVGSGSGLITPMHYPYMYRIEVLGERETNPDERAHFTVLYAY